MYFYFCTLWNLTFSPSLPFCIENKVNLLSAIGCYKSRKKNFAR